MKGPLAQGDSVACLLLAAICLSGSAWAVISWESAIDDTIGLLLFIISPLVVGGLFIGCVFISRPNRLMVLIFSASSVAGLYLTESYIRFYQDLPNSVRLAAKAAGRDYDSRTRFEVVNDQRKLNLRTFPYIAQLGFMWSARRYESHTGNWPLIVNGEKVGAVGTISNAKIVSCNENGQYIIYDTDRYGLNNPDRVWDSDSHDIAVVGDSFGNGNCVAPPEQAINRLRETYPLTINLSGAPGGPLSYLTAIQEYGRKIKPKLIIWMYYENDAVDLAGEKEFDFYTSQIERAQPVGLIHAQKAIDAAMTKLTDFEMMLEKKRRASPAPAAKSFAFSSDFFLLRELRNNFQLYFRKPPHDFDLFRATLEKAKQTTGEWGAKIIFVYQPNTARFVLSPLHFRLSTWVNGKILEIVEALDIPIINMHSVFNNVPDPTKLMFFPGSHYSGAGYGLVADTITQQIQILEQRNEVTGIYSNRR